MASGSDDGTVKIWELKGLDEAICPRAALTYRQQARERVCVCARRLRTCGFLKKYRRVCGGWVWRSVRRIFHTKHTSNLTTAAINQTPNPPPQGGRIRDLAMVDNSHSVASASSQGSLHVWRVDVCARRPSFLSDASTPRFLESVDS